MKVIGVIMGGGAGTRLQPLTRDRAKPAVPIGGKYRLVDIPISNLLNSHIRQIYLLTQFNSVSLHEHVTSTYQFDQFHRGNVRILAAQQTPDSVGWYEGTADAVRKSFRYFLDERPRYIAILSGDQLYRISFEEMIRRHEASGAEVTIATKPVPRHEAKSLGLMKIDADSRIVRFVEKPGDTAELDELRLSDTGGERYLASMGIYLFNTSVLQDLLEASEQCDFGKHIIPEAIRSRRVCSYVFDGYWKDIGTVRSFWEANLELTEPNPTFTFYDSQAPIYTHMRYLPPSKINCCDLNRCLLSEGCIISGHRILHSIVGIRATIGEGSVIEHSVIMGADYFEREKPPRGEVVPMGIGRDCFIRNAIIDKNARIGDGVYLTPDGKPDNTVTPNYTIRDGIIVVPKNAVIPSGTRV